MKRLFAFLLIFLALNGKTFLVKKRATKREPAHLLRQQITERMGALLEQYAQQVEQAGRIQQTLCNEIKRSLEGSTKIVKPQQLKELIRDLEAEQLRLTRQNELQKRFFTCVQS